MHKREDMTSGSDIGSLNEELQNAQSLDAEPVGHPTGTFDETSQEIGDELEENAPLDYVSANVELRLRYSDTQVELEILRDRLARIRNDIAQIVQARMEWADASAHAQLGEYPWAKLAAAMAASFVATKALRALPLAAAGSAVLPMVISALQRKAVPRSIR
ncbi:hypothetical protein QTL95_21315 [Rhizobium sp. S152]|uniref:hypothetical protein n=1 Tax=Rhizobium sp. S152 TaxID=3055038 RepID=UPI0025A96670|nr:hypothetical protein [Rhizobium sp. S152]MDM9628441.1 hypothetical protein [Rhizobium sp. S152]